MSEQKYASWNPWHGCTKYSEGCRYCYVYRQDEAYGSPISSEQCRKTQNFDLPVKKKRDGTMKIESDSIVMTCFTSDFLLKDADEWRDECWKMIKSRNDCMFYFFTKRIERFSECAPSDWGDGYDNVIVGCTCENQDRADFRLPIFAELPIKHKTVILGPMLGPVDLEKYLNGSICEVACSGESGVNVRPLDYDWVLDVRRQCMNKGVPFQFHQTGACFIKDGRMYRIPRRFQTSQARKAGIDYKIVDGYIPDFKFRMYIVKAEENNIKTIVDMSVRAFETDVNVGGTRGDCPPGYDSVEWHKQMAREGHLYQAMIGKELLGAAVVFPDESKSSVYIGRIFIDSIYHRKGYGILLMKCIENEFLDVSEINLDTPSWNVRTNAFYEKLGYKKVKIEDGFVFYQKKK